MEIYLIEAISYWPLAIGIAIGFAASGMVYYLLHSRQREFEQQCSDLQNTLSARESEIENLKSEQSRLQVEVAVRDSQLSHSAELQKKSEEALRQQMNLMKEQMLNATHDMLKVRQDELNMQNKQQIGAILNPLQEEIKQMKDAVDKSKTTQTEAQAALKTQIDLLMRQSMDIGTKADNLARALTAESKTQGNFGEVKLVELLESMELEKGIHFDIQETLRDEMGNSIVSEEGRRLIPDVILHFTDNRDAIIDSKMSITAFENYMNAANEEERQTALKAHIASVRKHVDELSRKNYSQYIKKGHQGLNYVIMYMFSETALQLALCNDTGLWKYAFDRNVFITGSQNLYAILRLTKESWTLVEQTKNQERMMQCADNIVHRVQLFSQRFKRVGDLLGDLSDAYRQVQTTTAESGQSIIVAARQLTALGAKQDKGKKSQPLPDSENFNLEE